MLSIFRTQSFGANLWIIPYLLVIRLSSFTHPKPLPKENLPLLGKYTLEYFASLPPIVNSGIAVGLVFIQCILINMLVSRFKFSLTDTQIPGVIYGLLCSMFPSYLTLSGELFSNLFLIIALYQLLICAYEKSFSDKLFNAGFWLSIASLFYFSSISFLFVAMLAVSQHKSGNLKNQIIIWIAAFIPYYLIWTIYYFMDSLTFLYQVEFSAISIPGSFIGSGITTIAQVVIVLFLVVLMVLNYGEFRHKKTLQTQQNLNLLYWWMLLIPVGLLYQSGISIAFTLQIMIALSVCVSMFFQKIRKEWADAYHLIWVALVIVFQYIEYLL